MESKFKKIFVSCAIALQFCNVYAGDASGLVTLPGVIGAVFIFGAGEHNNRPTCAANANSNQSWAFDATSAGKAMQAVVLTAYAQGKYLKVVGSGTCVGWPDRETPAYVYIMN